MFDHSIENHSPNYPRQKLKNVCHTRMVEQIIGLDSFEDLLISTVFC